jgi:hypothetical protein
VTATAASSTTTTALSIGGQWRSKRGNEKTNSKNEEL